MADGKSKILIVEDDRDLMEVYEEFFLDVGGFENVEFVLASDIAECRAALDICFAKNENVLIFSDENLLGESATVFLRQYLVERAKNEAGLKNVLGVAMFSGYSIRQAFFDLKEICDSFKIRVVYFSKPGDVEVITAFVRDALGSQEDS